MTAPIWYDSTEAGAPVLNNVAGSMIALLRAVLINGFNVKSVSGITVADEVATVTCPAHGYDSSYGKWLEITGASAPALSGVKQQTIVDANTFTYPAPGVADGSYTATDARRAPLGWTEVYANGGGTKAIFSRESVEANDVDLRVDDSTVSPASTTFARVTMVRGATDVDTYASRAPLDAQVSGGLASYKGGNTSAAKYWVLVGSGFDLWLFVAETTAFKYQPSISFFDGVAFRPGDVNLTGLAASAGSLTPNIQSSVFAAKLMTDSLYPTTYGVLYSDDSGAGSPEAFSVSSPFRTGGVGANVTGPSTNPLDYAVAFDPFVRGAAVGVRGTIPGIGDPFVRSDAMGFDRHQLQVSDNGVPGLLVKINYGGSIEGMVAFRLTDWR